jgi:hypothetical protein
MPAEKLKLSSKSNRHVVKAVTADSTLTCAKTSHPDVYVNGILAGEQHSLYLGDSMYVPKGTLTIWVFRVSPDPAEFWAELELKAV